MALKVVPFERKEDGAWHGKFGRIKVVVRQDLGATFWRGPDKEVVLERGLDSYNFELRGCYSGWAGTLAGAFERAEVGCYNEQDRVLDRPRYAMTEEERELEAQALRSHSLAAIEADRIAFERGWETSVDVLPELKALAGSEGLYPFDVASEVSPPRL